MSWRTWLGPEREDWCDYNLCDYPSLEALCDDAKWRLPAKAFAPNVEIMTNFLKIMEEQFYMPPDEFSLFIENAPSGPDRWIGFKLLV